VLGLMLARLICVWQQTDGIGPLAHLRGYTIADIGVCWADPVGHF